MQMPLSIPGQVGVTSHSDDARVAQSHACQLHPRCIGSYAVTRFGRTIVWSVNPYSNSEVTAVATSFTEEEQPCASVYRMYEYLFPDENGWCGFSADA